MHTLRELKVHPDISIGVTSLDYPYITEWDWRLEGGHAIRTEEGKTIYLIHELIAFNFKKKERPLSLLGHRMMHLMYGKSKAYRKLRRIYKIVQSRATSAGYKLPQFTEIVSVATTLAFCEFLYWKDTKIRYEYDSVEDGVSIGVWEQEYDYSRMGDWMFQELTGVSDSMGPEDYADKIARMVVSLFVAGISEVNPHVAPEAVWEAITGEEHYMELTTAYMHEVLTYFPLPEKS